MSTKIGRNDSCPCGSGKKFKKCCIDKFAETPRVLSEYDSVAAEARGMGLPLDAAEKRFLRWAVNNKKEVAIHEAAHAVVAVCLNAPIQEVRVSASIAGGNLMGGYVSFARGWSTLRRNAAKDMAIALAGPIAQKLFKKETPDTENGWRIREGEGPEDVRGVAGDLGTLAFWIDKEAGGLDAQLKTELEELLYEHVFSNPLVFGNRVLRVADACIDNEFVTAETVKWIIRKADRGLPRQLRELRDLIGKGPTA